MLQRHFVALAGLGIQQHAVSHFGSKVSAAAKAPECNW